MPAPETNAMNEDGYTLAEVLAAMLILGLAIGGLVEGSRIVGRMQTPIVSSRRNDQVLRAAEASVAGLLRLRPGGDQTLSGNDQGFQFTCRTAPCGLALLSEGQRQSLVVKRGEVAQSFSLPQAGKFSLVYFARDGRFDRWPQPDSKRVLEGVMIVETSAQGELPLVVARSWIEHPKTCEFDMIAKGCRTSVP